LQTEVYGGILNASWDARASFLLVCSNFFRDDGTGENNGFPGSLEMTGRLFFSLPFLIFSDKIKSTPTLFLAQLKLALQ